MIKRQNPMEGAFNFLEAFLSGDNPYPDWQTTNKVESGSGTVTIDTSLPKDTGIYETGIHRLPDFPNWCIVEQYETEEEALAGHEKWVALITKDPDAHLVDIDLWGLGNLSSLCDN